MQPSISVLVIEDELIWATQLNLSLERLGFVVTGSFDAIDTAIAALPKTEFDIALLDISIDGKNTGIELGKIIRTVYNKPIIFITGSLDKHTIDEALMAQPSAYLTKPVNDTSLFVAVQQALQNYSNNTVANIEINEPDYFFVKTGNRYKKILWKEIVCLCAEHRYVSIILNNEETIYYLRSSLQKILQSVIPIAYKNNLYKSTGVKW